MPVGATKVRHADVRFVAATNKDLQTEVARGTFREDLFYRLNVVTLQVPPLRERKDDVAPLAEFFLLKFGNGSQAISSEAMAQLRTYDWPGNVRELENVIERAAILCQGGVIRSEDLAIRVQAGQAQPSVDVRAAECAQPEAASMPDDAYCSRRDQIMANFERKELERFLRQAEGNVSEAARISGIPRRTLYRKMKRFGL